MRNVFRGSRSAREDITHGFSTFEYFDHTGTEMEIRSMAKQSQMSLNEAVGKRLLNVREAAQYLGLAVDTVYRMARLRELPCVKVGRALRSI